MISLLSLKETCVRQNPIFRLLMAPAFAVMDEVVVQVGRLQKVASLGSSYILRVLHGG